MVQCGDSVWIGGYGNIVVYDAGGDQEVIIFILCIYIIDKIFSRIFIYLFIFISGS